MTNHVDTERRFAWNPTTADDNAFLHGVSFLEAASVFRDPYAQDERDVPHSADETSFLYLGRSVLGRVLVVIYALRRSRNVETIHVISAQRASREAQEAYGHHTED